MSEPKRGPWWTILLPEPRYWIALGYFILSWRLLEMVDGNPRLLENAAFMTIAALIVGSGGLGVVASFYFGGTKTGADVMTDQSKKLNAPATGSDEPAPTEKAP